MVTKDIRMKTRETSFPPLLALLGLLLSAISCAPAAIAGAPAKYALIVGISDYLDEDLADLVYPSSDADSLAGILASQDWTVLTLKDAAATKAGIRAGIAGLFQDIPADSTALIYYSGHGTESGGKAFLVPSDYDPSSLSPLVSPEELGAWISEYIPTDNVIVIADSCYSGGFVGYSDSSDSISSPYDSAGGSVSISALAALSDFGTLLARNAEATGALAPIAISAAGNLELSWETEVLGHGVFTYYLLESAAEGDADGNGYVTCTEAYTYAAKAVDREWNRLRYSSEGFYPHITDGLRDLVLFTAAN